MNKSQDIQTQEKVDTFFKDTATYWKSIYDSKEAEAVMYVKRQNTTIKWVEELAPDPNVRVLDIGCGAGELSITLAARGIQVHAIDPVEEMVEQARHSAEEAGVTDRLTLGIGNIYALDIEDASFDIVIALGVFCYLDQPEAALREMIRVTKPGGYLIFSTDNQLALIGWFDPLRNSFLRSLWLPIKSALLQRGIRISNPWPDAMTRSGHPWPDLMPGSPRLTDKLLKSSSLTKVRGITLGFYPFTFLGHTLLPKSLGLWLARQLEQLAARRVPGLRTIGDIYLVSAKTKEQSGISERRLIHK